MAVHVSSISASASRMTTGERRLAGRRDAEGLTKRVHMRNFHNRGRQQLYKRQRSKQFSFKSVGLQAQGRTTVLKINYRNTRQILQTASQIAGGLLTADNSEQGEDGIPLLLPVSCGREGPEPMVINLPTLHEEAAKVAELLSAAHQEGHAWGDMAVLCRALRRDGGMCACVDAAQVAASGAQGVGGFQAAGGQHQGDDDACEQGVGIPCGGSSWSSSAIT